MKKKKMRKLLEKAQADLVQEERCAREYRRDMEALQDLLHKLRATVVAAGVEKPGITFGEWVDHACRLLREHTQELTCTARGTVVRR